MKPASRVLQKPPWGIREVFVWLFIAQFSSIAIYLLVVGLAYGSEPVPSPLPIWLLVLSSVGLWFGYGIGPVREAIQRGHGVEAELGLRARYGEYGAGALLGVVTQLVLLPLLYVPILWLNPDADVGEAAEELVAGFDTLGEQLLFFFVAVVAAPVVEELFYRGLMLRGLTHYLPAWLSVVTSALVFAAIHFQLLQLPGLFLFGLIAGSVVLYTGKVGVSIAMHMAFNLVTVLILFWL